MQYVDYNNTYLYSGDYQRLYNNEWVFSITTTTQECRSNSQTYTGSEAYQICSEYLE